jgi:hypothetical protein
MTGPSSVLYAWGGPETPRIPAPDKRKSPASVTVIGR